MEMLILMETLILIQIILEKNLYPDKVSSNSTTSNSIIVLLILILIILEIILILLPQILLLFSFHFILIFGPRVIIRLQG